MKQKQLNRWNATAAYSMLQIVCWGFYAITLCFSSNVLYGYGFRDDQISILLGICTAVSFGLQLILAELIAKCPKMKVWGVLTVVGITMVISNFVVWMPGIPSFIAIPFFGLSCVLLQTMPSWVNAIGMDAIKRGSPANYSIARGIGSLGYSILAYATGMLVREYGYRMVPALGGMVALVLVISAVWFHYAGEHGLPEVVQMHSQEKKSSSFLKQYPLFAVFLAGSIALQFSHNLVSNFMYQIMLTKNGGAGEQGIATAICAFVELPVMFFFPLLMRKIRCDKWVRFASLFIAVKSIGIFLSATPYGIYVAQATQMLGYGLYTISSVNYAEMVVGRGESIRAQTYLGATCTVGNLLAMSTGGFLCQHLGPQAMVLVSLIAALAGGFTILFTAEKTRDY